MSDLVAQWDWDTHSRRAENKEVRDAQAEWLHAFFGGAGKTPDFIWRVEFFTERSTSMRVDELSMTLHRYAKAADGFRFWAWVKVYDSHGSVRSERHAAVLEPENYRLDHLPPAGLPPAGLLYPGRS
jgi:hypothetical protein